MKEINKDFFNKKINENTNEFVINVSSEINLLFSSSEGSRYYTLNDVLITPTKYTIK